MKPAHPVTCIEDLRTLARRRVPTMFYDYIDCGSWTESSYRANRSDLDGLRLRQRVGVSVAGRSLRASILGQEAAMPVAIAPTGIAGMQYADGEILAARAAERFGVPFTLSTMSVCSIEDVAAQATKPFWFQLYVMKDRDFVRRLVERARAAGCSALVVTLDLPVQGQRHKDLKNGLSTPPKLTLRNLVDLAVHPRWCLNMLGTRRRSFGNIVGHVRGVSDMASMALWVREQFDQTVSWDDVKRLRDAWGGKFIVKGVMDPEDAEHAVTAGADAIVVSNHGGRQLDGAPSSISALPAIAARVGQRVEVLFDSGVASGQDVLKALAAGAHAAMIGRAYLYGLAALGEAGVTRCLQIIQNELDLSMALCGLRSVDAIAPSVLVS